MKTATRLVTGVTLAALIGLVGPAGANDSTAALTNNGLVLTKTTAVEMRSENLYISDKAVRVKYSFLNTSAKDVTVTVAFPIPDVVVDGPDSPVDIPDYNAANFLGFVTTVDGKAVPAQIEQKAIKNGVDVTAYLKSLGLPVAPFFDATSDALNRMPAAQQDDLIKRGLAMVASDEPRELIGLWTLKTTFFWNQTFPAGRAVVIEHDYTPSVAGSAVFVEPPATMVADLKQYCVDSEFVAGVSKMAPSPNAPLPSPEYISYVLVTGANWAAPIGDFQMTIDKGSPANLVSFCGTGVTKTGPTTFAVHYTNFTPTANVSVLLLIPHAAN